MGSASMNPATAQMIAALGSSMLGGMMSPGQGGQTLRSFEGVPGLDPRTLMGESKGMLSDYLSALIDEAGKDTTIKTTVNPLPSFTGGGLPMSISATGMDPNRVNPALRTSPGVSIQKRSLSAPTPRSGSGTSTTSPGISSGGIATGPDGKTYAPVPQIPHGDQGIWASGEDPFAGFESSPLSADGPEAAAAALKLLMGGK